MSDERAFFRAISSKPLDRTVRLVYADWLEERNDPRAEFVRVQVQLSELPPDDPSRPAVEAREQKLRAACPAYWLARLDPPVWCLAGNIVVEHAAGPGGREARRGTRLLRAGAKLYLADNRHTSAVFESGSRRYESLRVVAQHRQSRNWILCWVRAQHTTSWRVQLVHQPGVIVRLREVGWVGFSLKPGSFACPEGRQDESTILTFLETAFAARYPRM
jgi:uncharacterized protein (TIGR02996 family)